MIELQQSRSIPEPIAKFKSQIPMLNEFEMQVTDKGDEFRFSWQNLSIFGQPNWASFYTDKNNGLLTQIVVCIGLSKNDEIKRMESTVLAYKILQTVSGKTISIIEFKQWINLVIQSAGGEKQFGETLVRYLVTEAEAGFVALLIIDNKLKEKSKYSLNGL